MAVWYYNISACSPIFQLIFDMDLMTLAHYLIKYNVDPIKKVKYIVASQYFKLDIPTLEH